MTLDAVQLSALRELRQRELDAAAQRVAQYEAACARLAQARTALAQQAVAEQSGIQALPQHLPALAAWLATLGHKRRLLDQALLQERQRLATAQAALRAALQAREIVNIVEDEQRAERAQTLARAEQASLDQFNQRPAARRGP